MVNKKTPPMKFKSFVMLFFQDSIQGANKEIEYQKDLRKFYMKSMRKLLPMSNENVVEHCKELSELKAAYKDFLETQGYDHE